MEKREAVVVCLKCKSDVRLDVKFCTSCGYPQNGSAKEKNTYRIRKKIEANKLKEVELAATAGKSVLFFLGFVYLVEPYQLHFWLQHKS